MLIDDILSQIGNDGTPKYFAFETFILNLLRIHINDQNKTIILTTNNKGIGDAIAEDGFDDFTGKTIIEITSSIERSVTHLLLEIVGLDKLNDTKNLIIISLHRVSAIVTKRIEVNLEVINTSMKVTIWGPDEINSIVIKHESEALNIAKNLFSLRVEEAVKKDLGDWKKDREERIIQLSEYYKRGQFTIFVGAGVSSSAGMPDWNTLLNSLFVSYLTNTFDGNSDITDKDIIQIAERLNQLDEPSALMAARYLRKGLSKELGENKEFIKTITENLYKLRDKTKPIASLLIKTIANLCLAKRTGAKVKSVITYNFDDLLERELDKTLIQNHSIYTENEFYSPDDLPVYHVHGFLPENVQKYESLEKSTLVFSEEGYHQIYSEPYHWSNLVQLANLRENNCLMVGLSMTDPNLRRLLDISARNLENPRHFTFMRRMDIETFAYEKIENGKPKVQLIDKLKNAKEFLNRHHKLNEELMRELGVSIIWFSDFTEIPEILQKINQ